MRQALIAAWHRLRAVVLRRRLERDLDDELAFHLSMREADYAADGAAPRDARDLAQRRFGNATYIKEQMRDTWTFPTLESVRQDVRYALRALRRSPGFSAVAIAAMAIGIGANTAIFSLVDAVRAGALPYREPDRLVEILGNVQRASVERRGASYPDFLDWRAQSKSFEDVAAFDSQWLTLVGSGPDEPERMLAESVSAQYFAVLGVSPARGRVFRADEDLVSRPAPVVVLSDGLWKRRFAADPDIVGRTVTLCCAPRQYTIVGVMPPGFSGVSDTAELWVPFALWAAPSTMAERGTRGFAALARLKPGVTLRAAQSDMDTISRRLEQAYPDTNEKRAAEVSPLDVELFGDLRPALLALMAAVAFVLLIACANVANLLIARSETRRREIAVRTALGAGRGRLVRQFVTESCVLTGLGAAAGLMLARAVAAALLAWSPVTFPSFVSPALNARAALFTIAVSLVCGLMVGLVSGLRNDGGDLGRSLKESARSSGGREAQRLRGVLVVVEVSLAVVLLVGAGLMIRSVRNLAALNPGFDPHSVLAVHASIPRVASRPAVEGRALLDRLRAVPGVAAAALTNGLPLDGDGGASFYSAEGQPEADAQNRPRIYVHVVTPELFSTLKIPFVAGRTFDQNEISQTTTAAIVSENVVRRFWPGQDPIGKRLKFGRLASDNPWFSIVGVVADVKYRGLPQNPTSDPDIYLPFADRNSLVAIALRTTVPPASVVGAVRAAIHAADRSIAVYNVVTLDDLVSRQTSRSQFMMWLMGLFAGVALLLATVGIYGVMSYLVTQRTPEIGIRLALGATAGDIVRLVAGSGVRLVGAGIAIGAVASFALARLLTTLLFGVTAVDAAAGIAIAVLAAVALLACYVPALRASRVNPLRALRYE